VVKNIKSVVAGSMEYLIIGFICFCLGLYAGNQKFRKGLHDSFNAVAGKNKDDKQQPDKKGDKNAHNL